MSSLGSLESLLTQMFTRCHCFPTIPPPLLIFNIPAALPFQHTMKYRRKTSPLTGYCTISTGCDFRCETSPAGFKELLPLKYSETNAPLRVRLRRKLRHLSYMSLITLLDVRTRSTTSEAHSLGEWTTCGPCTASCPEEPKTARSASTLYFTLGCPSSWTSSVPTSTQNLPPIRDSVTFGVKVRALTFTCFCTSKAPINVFTFVEGFNLIGFFAHFEIAARGTTP